MSQTMKAGKRTSLALGASKPRKSSIDLSGSPNDKSNDDVIFVENIKPKVQQQDQQQTQSKSELETQNGNSKGAISSKNGSGNGFDANKDKTKSTTTSADVPAKFNDNNKTDKTTNNKKDKPNESTKSEKSPVEPKTTEAKKSEEIKHAVNKLKETVPPTARGQEEKKKDEAKTSSVVPAAPSKDLKETTEMGKIPIVTLTAPSPKQEAKTVPVASPSKDTKNLKQSKKNGDQKEESFKLELEPDTPEKQPSVDSPMPKEKSTSKVLKLKQGPPTRQQRTSPLRKITIDKLENASTIVNLSTVSEQSTESEISSAAATPSDPQKYGSNLRMISGRRSTRTLAPYKPMSQHSLYRRLPTEFDDSISSLNVTIGSEIASADSIRTPILAVKGLPRKRAVDDSDHSGIDEDIDQQSPKKRRLDVSGFFGILASPITMLRHKFQRTKIQCSTPNQIAVDVAVAATEDEQQMDLGSNLNLNESEIEPTADENKIEDAAAPAAGDENAEEAIQMDKKIELEQEDAGKFVDDEIKIREIKRSRCNVM